MPAADDTRAALVEELQSVTPDLDRVAELSSKLLGEDPDRARFSVDAGVLARLGRELVARHETALSELVKNAYDADATEVVVTVAGPTKGDFIEIVDNGNGMDREALISGFMRLATNDKVEHPHSERFDRRRAGRKGVGRFAAERLGRRLVLTSAKEGAKDALRVDIDWNRFVAGSDLASVSLPVTTVPAGRLHGTKLRIEKLRDSWSTDARSCTPASVLRLRRRFRARRMKLRSSCYRAFCCQRGYWLTKQCLLFAWV